MKQDDIPHDVQTTLQFHLKSFLCILKSTYNIYVCPQYC